MNICRPFGLTIQRNTWSTSCPEIKPNIGQLSISSVEDWNRTLHLVEEFGHHASACLGMLSGCSCCCTLPSVPSGLSSRKALCQSTTSSGLYAVCFTRKSTWKTRQEIVFRTITKAFFFPPQIVPACFLVHCSSYIFRLSPGASPSNNVHEGFRGFWMKGFFGNCILI